MFSYSLAIVVAAVVAQPSLAGAMVYIFAQPGGKV